MPDPSEFEPTYGEPFEATAVVVFAPRPEGKGNQGTWLVADDGRSWLASYAPMKEWYPWADKHVVFAGRPYMPSKYVQSVQEEHIEITSIALAPGETAGPATDELPAPPTVTSADALGGRIGRYAIAFGKSGPTAAVDEGYISKTRLSLRDGGEVQATIWARGPSAEQLAAGFEGSYLVHVNGPDEVAVLFACAGEDPRCGVTTSE